MISLNEIRKRALEFSHEWEGDFSEDAEAKSFWDGFFDVFGVSRRRVASFEYPIKKIDGKDGFIDVIWKGNLLVEHKSRGKSLERAFTQAKDYFPGLKDSELPRYIIVSDFEKIRLYDLDRTKEVEFLLKDLHKNIEIFEFISGHKLDVNYGKEEDVSIKGAKLMADFHNEIEKTGYAGHELEVFLIRILFCLFADDTGIFEKGIFRNYIENRINKDGSDLGIQLGQIFHILNTPFEKRQTTLDEQLMRFPYINGGIFAENLSPISLDVTAYLKLLKCCEFDWSGISASIFGSLFQGVMDEESRSQLGAHYTSEINILKLIHPLFLDELYIEFDKAKHDRKKLEKFHDYLATLTFLDPACGCGNFLVTTYRELRRLELEVLKYLRKDFKMVLFGAEDISKIQVTQFYGIEIEEFPALVAKTAMYLVDHQMNMELSETFGQAYARIPLREPATIVHADALEIDWEKIISKDKLAYILGNPPFLGQHLQTEFQKEQLNKIFLEISASGVLDFVTAWYGKTAQYIQNSKIKVAFVSTNSIVQGEQVGILWKHLIEKKGLIIHFAHQTFKWNNDAPGVAAVYCVIIGFACFDIPKKYLFEYETIKSEPKEREVENINAYLVAGENVFIENRNSPICEVPKMMYGNKPTDNGYFLFTNEEKEVFLSSEPIAEKFFKPFISAKEFLNNEKRWVLWLVGADPAELRKLPKVLERIEMVRNFRLSSKAKSTRDYQHPSLFRQVTQPDSDYVVIPSTSSENRKYIPMGFFTKDDIVSNSCHAVVGANLYHFGVLQSSMHMTWVSYTCGRLKSDYRYSKDIVYNNFPWPENITKEQEKKIEVCAQAVLDSRSEFSTSSLADLYYPNTMPQELVKAHNELDKAVDESYGRKFANKEERIEFLFELYKKYTLNK